MIPETDSFLCRPSHVNEASLEYMWIGPSEKLLVSTGTVSVDPFRVVPLAVHFAVTGPGAVDVRLAGSVKWITHGLRQDGETLWWTINGKEVPWTFVSIDTVPPWAHKIFARGKAKLLKETQNAP